MASITIVVGTGGWPTHASLQLNEGDTTTYFGFGPVKSRPYYDAQYDKAGPLPNGESPVGLSNGTREFQYVNAEHYNVTSFTMEIPAGQGNPSDVIQSASEQYIRDNPNYDFAQDKICTDYVLYVAQKAIPGSDLSQLSRLPWELRDQLTQITEGGNGQLTIRESGDEFGRVEFSKIDTGLAGLQQDSNPPQFRESEYTGTFDQRFPAPTFDDRFSAAPSEAGSPIPYLQQTQQFSRLLSNAELNDSLQQTVSSIDGTNQQIADYNAKLSPTFNDRFSAVAPLTANGVLQGNTVLNGAILNTQTGQIAFGTPNGPSDKTANWPGYFANNVNSTPTIDVSALNVAGWMLVHALKFIVAVFNRAIEYLLLPVTQAVRER